MVTFRFYVVSTAAFFLALAVGVVVGSVLDGQIADSFQDRVAGLEQSLDENVASIDDKNAQIDEFEQFGTAVAPFALENRLNDTTTMLVAEQGIAAAVVEDQVRQLRLAGSSVEGIIWLERRWELEDRADRTLLAELVGHSGAEPAGVRSAAWTALLGDATPGAGDGASGATQPGTSDPATTDPAAGSSTTDPTSEASQTPAAFTFDGAAITAMADAGLVRLQRVDGDNPAPGQTLVVVGATGAESDLAAPGAVTIELVRTAADLGHASVLGEATERKDLQQPERGVIIGTALSAGPVEFSTVDALDLLAGRVAVPLALAEGQRGVVGRYGYGPNVDGVLPPISVP